MSYCSFIYIGNELILYGVHVSSQANTIIQVYLIFQTKTFKIGHIMTKRQRSVNELLIVYTLKPNLL